MFSLFVLKYFIKTFTEYIDHIEFSPAILFLNYRIQFFSKKK